MFSNSCFGVGRVRLNCSFPGRLVGGMTVRGLHVCNSLRSFFAFASCPNFSPRIANIKGSLNISGNDCPGSGGIILNLDIAF